MNQDFRTLWKSSESFLKFETFGKSSKPSQHRNFLNLFKIRTSKKNLPIYKLSHESCSENKTLFSHKINLIAEYHSSLNQRASLNTLLENFLFIYPRGRARPARPREERYRSKPLTPPSYLTWNGRCSEHLFTFRPRFTAPREQARNKLHELTTLARYTQPACNEAS